MTKTQQNIVIKLMPDGIYNAYDNGICIAEYDSEEWTEDEILQMLDSGK